MIENNELQLDLLLDGRYRLTEVVSIGRATVAYKGKDERPKGKKSQIGRKDQIIIIVFSGVEAPPRPCLETLDALEQAQRLYERHVKETCNNYVRDLRGKHSSLEEHQRRTPELRAKYKQKLHADKRLHQKFFKEGDLELLDQLRNEGRQYRQKLEEIVESEIVDVIPLAALLGPRRRRKIRYKDLSVASEGRIAENTHY